MKFFLLFFLLPLKIFSQDIEGVWTGTIYNDTTRKYIPYEIAISENSGKLSGFSHTIFISENNKQETGVKTLKIKNKGGKILIEDDELIFNNYDVPAPKGVRQFSVLNIMQGDSGLLLIGAFNTNRTKQYASATGTIHLEKKKIIASTKLIPKLEEMNLANSLSFNKPKAIKQEEAVVVNDDKNKSTTAPQISLKSKDSALTTYNKVVSKKLPDTARIQPQVVTAASLTKATKTLQAKTVEKKSDTEFSLITINQDEIEYEVDVKEGATNKKIKNKAKKDSIIIAKKIAESAKPNQKTVVNISSAKKETPALPTKELTVNTVKEEKRNQPAQQIKPKEVAINTSKAKQEVFSKPNTETAVKTKEVISIPNPKNNDQTIVVPTKSIINSASVLGPVVSAEALSKRKIETIRTVDFKSDSLMLTLYDNGVVDGDSVSVILNGKTIISKKMLTTKALTKTIYITPDLGDSIQLIMYAENLGSIAPNTGLLIIQDGEERYQIRFSGDLEKNAAIILRRKSIVNSH